MKIIFLDFDGVLVTHRQWRARQASHRSTDDKTVRLRAMADPECVANLNRLLEATDAQIVVSSTWRKVRKGKDSLAYVRDVLTTWGVDASRVIGVTPSLEVLIKNADGERVPLVLAKERGYEIQAWLNSADVADGSQFAILDDDSDMAHLKHRLVQTKLEDGLQAHHVERAMQILSCGAR